MEEAVRFINERTILSGLALAREVGEYVLTRFFDGDFEEFSNPSRTKPVAFRELMRRQDLILGGSAIYSFVRVSHHLKLLPESLATLLPLSHHRALLPLSNPEEKVEFAVKALQEGWSAEELERQVRSVLPKSRAGRKPLPLIVKGVRRAEKILLGSEGNLEEDIRRLSDREARELTQKIGSLRDRLDALDERLAKAG